MPSLLPTLLVVFCDFLFFSNLNLVDEPLSPSTSVGKEICSTFLTYSNKTSASFRGFVRLVLLDQVDVLLFGP